MSNTRATKGRLIRRFHVYNETNRIFSISEYRDPGEPPVDDEGFDDYSGMTRYVLSDGRDVRPCAGPAWCEVGQSFVENYPEFFESDPDGETFCTFPEWTTSRTILSKDKRRV